MNTEYTMDDIVRFKSGTIKCHNYSSKKVYDLYFDGTCGSKYENKDELSKIIVDEGTEALNQFIKQENGNLARVQAFAPGGVSKYVTENIKSKYNTEIGCFNMMIHVSNIEDLVVEEKNETPKYKFCPNCGTQIANGKFCPNCGGKVND